MKNTCYTFLDFFLMQCYSQVAKNHFFYFKIFCFTSFTQVLSHNCNKKLRVRNAALKLHEESFSSQDEMFNCNTLLKTKSQFFNRVPVSLVLPRSQKTSRSASRKHLQVKSLPGRILRHLRKQGSSQHGNPIKKSKLDIYTLLEDIDDMELTRKPKSCKHSSFTLSFRKVETVYLNLLCQTKKISINKKLDHVYKQFKRAAKLNFVFGFV